MAHGTAQMAAQVVVPLRPVTEQAFTWNLNRPTTIENRRQANQSIAPPDADSREPAENGSLIQTDVPEGDEILSSEPRSDTGGDPVVSDQLQEATNEETPPSYAQATAGGIRTVSSQQNYDAIQKGVDRLQTIRNDSTNRHVRCARLREQLSLEEAILANNAAHEAWIKRAAELRHEGISLGDRAGRPSLEELLSGANPDPHPDARVLRADEAGACVGQNPRIACISLDAPVGTKDLRAIQTAAFTAGGIHRVPAGLSLVVNEPRWGVPDRREPIVGTSDLDSICMFCLQNQERILSRLRAVAAQDTPAGRQWASILSGETRPIAESCQVFRDRANAMCPSQNRKDPSRVALLRALPTLLSSLRGGARHVTGTTSPGPAISIQVDDGVLATGLEILHGAATDVLVGK